MPRASSNVDDLQVASPFQPFRVPEMTKDHEIIGSLVRNLIGISEEKGLRVAKTFKPLIETAKAVVEDTTATIEAKNAIAHAILEHLAVPATGSGKRGATVPLLVPLTPALAQVTAFTRHSGKPWNPGMYLKGMILRGSDSQDHAHEIWTSLGQAIAIESWTEQRNDIWATLIEEHLTTDFATDSDGNECIQRWVGEVDDIRTLSDHPGPDALNITPCPARSFAKDLQILISLRPAVTRRQWISILDCFFRLALAADLLWIGRINQGLQSELLRHLASNDVEPVPSEIAGRLLKDFHPITIGDHVPTTLKRETRQYIQARLFISFLIDELRNCDPSFADIKRAGGLTSTDGICRLLTFVCQHGDPTLSERIVRRVSKVCEEEPDLMQCGTSGTVTANFRWCIRYALGQRHTTEEADSHFDQGYWCKKRGRHSGAPWIFEPGPIALITFAHLACSGSDGLGTVTDFRHRVAQYGVTISENELNYGKIGRDIRSLGLVIDSPDAEGGMLLRSPFSRMK